MVQSNQLWSSLDSCVWYLGPAALLAQQVGIEVSHLPHTLVGEAPHQLPVAHVVELFPGLLGLAAVLKELHRLVVAQQNGIISLALLAGSLTRIQPFGYLVALDNISNL